MPILIAENGERFFFDDEMNSPSFQSPLTVTAYPISAYDPVTVHVQKGQESLSTRLRVTGTNSTRYSADNVPTTEEQARDKFAEAVSFLRRHRTDAFTFISDVYGTVENFVIEDCSWSYDNIDRVDFNIKGVFVVTAVEQYVKVPPVRKKKKGTQKTKDKGDKTPKDLSQDRQVQSAQYRGNAAAGRLFVDTGISDNAPFAIRDSREKALALGNYNKILELNAKNKVFGPVRNLNTTRANNLATPVPPAGTNLQPF